MLAGMALFWAGALYVSEYLTFNALNTSMQSCMCYLEDNKTLAAVYLSSYPGLMERECGVKQCMIAKPIVSKYVFFPSADRYEQPEI